MHFPLGSAPPDDLVFDSFVPLDDVDYVPSNDLAIIDISSDDVVTAPLDDLADVPPDNVATVRLMDSITLDAGINIVSPLT